MEGMDRDGHWSAAVHKILFEVYQHLYNIRVELINIAYGMLISNFQFIFIKFSKIVHRKLIQGLIFSLIVKAK